MLAAKIGGAAVVAENNGDALRGVDAVILACGFPCSRTSYTRYADLLTDRTVVVPSNPFGIDAQGNVSRLLPKEQSSGEVIAGWLPAGARLAMAFGTMSGGLFEVFE